MGSEVKGPADLTDGVILARLLALIVPKAIDASTITRPPDENWILKVFYVLSTSA